MQELRLKSLSLRNFQGLRKFDLELDGEDAFVFGANDTGKTTIYSAFLWLLFGKNFEGKTDFEIKTLTSSGEPHHGIEHTVEAEFEVDGKSLNLKKVYQETWTKRRGSAEKTFSGHTTDYWINGVPIQKRDYDAQIAEICQEETFKLLTSAKHFNERLSWQERRQILLEICGDISDADVIASDKALSKLPEILNGRKLEDHRKVISAKRSEINKELEKIPVRIDEVEQGLPDVSNLDVSEIEQKRTILKTAIEEKQEEAMRIESGGEIAEKRKKLAETEAEILNVKNQLNAKISETINAKLQEQHSAKGALSNLKEESKDQEDEIKSKKAHIERLENHMEELRPRWEARNKEEFSYKQDDTCPACGQKLPKEKLEATREKALANFNQEKAEELERISKEGKEMKTEAEQLESEINEHNKHIDSIKPQIEVKEKEIQEIDAEIGKLQENYREPEENPEYKKKISEKEELDQAIAKLQEDNQEAVLLLRRDITNLTHELEGYEQDLANLKRHLQGKARVDELKAQEKTLATEYEKLEGELYLTEEFIRTKVNLLEDKINNRFKLARFKLFNILINGGVEECCETTFLGIPYSRGLNSSAQIKVGCDIIRTLSGHYGFSAPIFVDNRESVTELPEMNCQIISLVVSPEDKKLRIEIQKQAVKEAV